MVTRQDLQNAKKIVIKVGTSVLTRMDGTIALGRVGHLVEEICDLIQEGKQVALVSSGSTWIGRRKLKQKQELINSTTVSGLKNEKRAFAACGQSNLMSLYDILFSQKNVLCSQILLTGHDFETFENRESVKETLEHMMSLGVVPIINENDVVSVKSGRNLTDDHRFKVFNGKIDKSTKWSTGSVSTSPPTLSTTLLDQNELPSSEMSTTSKIASGDIFSNNDALASIVASELEADLLILLTDVDGLFEKPPGSEGPNNVIPTFVLDQQVATKYECGKEGSIGGTGGMMAKIDSALFAVSHSVNAVVISSGKIQSPISRVINGEEIGTLFVATTTQEENDENVEDSEKEVDIAPQQQTAKMAESARAASRQLALLTTEKRSEILRTLAQELLNRKGEIINENEKDLIKAKEMNVEGPLIKRLKLTSDKIETLSKGILQISEMSEPIGNVVRQSNISETLFLQQITVPIGVLLIIFESRPDVLPQIAALTIKTGNGVLMKGGKEATYSNRILHKIITDSITKVTGNNLISNSVGLVEDRKEISELLKMNEFIDLVIPRGSGSLVKYIQQNTKIPVLGHAEGICHVYIDKDADLEKAKKIVIDAKTDYPAACNSVETLLINKNFKYTKELLLEVTQTTEIQLFANQKTGNELKNLGVAVDLSEDDDDKLFTTEYGNCGLTVHFVENDNEAISHINHYGSHHTDCIVSECEETTQKFLKSIDSACVFYNCSTRFADGFRFGLGAEVGISTGRIHARGPVGMEGLLTTKWILTSKDCDLVKEYSENGCKRYLH
ncbi:hypothetical protein ABK040_005076 [Willaertia magna]